MADSAVMSLFAEIGLNANKFNAGLSGSKSDLDSFKKNILKVSDFAVASFAAMGVAAIAAGTAFAKAGWDAFFAFDDALTELKIRTGESGLALEGLGETSRKIFREGVGKDLNDVALAVSLVNQQIDSMYSDQFEEISRGALMLRDSLGLDMRESVDAIDQLMEHMGLTGTEAMDFITAGVQRGLNNNNDFIDSIREYSNQFGVAGFSATEFFSIMETGSAGGVLGTDKVADSIKELTNRFVKGDQTIKDGFDSMGWSWENLHNQVVAGTIDIADTFPQIITRLQEMKSSGQDWESATIDIFGTQAEDLRGLILELDAGIVSMADLAGSADVLKERYSTLPAQWEQIKRSFTDAMIPLGGMLAETVEEAMPTIQAAFAIFNDDIIPLLLEFGEEFKTTWDEVSATFVDAFSRIDEALGGTVGETDWLAVSLGALKIIFDAVIFSMETAAFTVRTIADGIEWVTGKMAPFIDAWETLRIKLDQVTNAFPEHLIPGSPPPFADGLDSVRSSLMSVNREFANFADVSGSATNISNEDNRNISLTVNRIGGNEVGVQDMQTLMSMT